MTSHTASLLYKKITSIAGMSEDNLKKLFGAITHKQLLKGENILVRGQVCNTIVFVEKGYLRTFIEKDGNEINTDFVFENNFTTNLKSLRSSLPSNTTITAGEKTEIYVFDKNTLLGLYKESPEIESFGRKLLEQLLIAQEEHTHLFKLYTPTERYHYLQSTTPELLQRISLSQLASYLGVTRETLTRIRKKK